MKIQVFQTDDIVKDKLTAPPFVPDDVQLKKELFEHSKVKLFPLINKAGIELLILTKTQPKKN
jgi:hypothetical protein